MLKVWDFGNHTVTELFDNLYQMNHARGMMLLQDYAGHMGFTADELNDFSRVSYMSHGSPSDCMLAAWDCQNHTITELFDKLYEMKHARGMMLLEDLVDAAHKEKIKKVQGEQPDDSNEDGATNTLPLNHQQQQQQEYHPNRRRQPEEDTDTSAKLQGGQPSDMPPGASYSPDGHGHPSTNMPFTRPQATQNQQRPHLSMVREAEASVPAAAPAPWDESQRSTIRQRPPDFTQQDAVRRNLDGGTQKHINSPSMKPSMPNYRIDGTKLSDDNNPADSGASAATGASAASAAKKKSEREEKERMQKLSSLSAVMTIKYEEIQRETQNFSDSYKLGSGSFGTVYYMVYVDTKYAIKRLHLDDNPSSNVDKRKSLLKEITTLATYRHHGIVTLCFYSTAGPEPCLVYEYLQNGSLEDNLQCRGPHKKPLEWERRNEIALGAAIALRFLHNAQDKPLIHGDIKSANILLDETFQPKIGDFGLARPGPENGCTQMTMKTSKAYGTLPYLPKDFLSSFKLSVKVDVYSFGIVLMEILTGEKAADEKREPQKWLSQIVIELVDSLKNERDFEQKLVDQLRDKRCSDWPWDLAWQMLELSLQCVHKFQQRRPEMKEVVKRLQEINDRIGERDALRNRSLPTQNTEPLSCYDQIGSAELPSEDPRVTTSTQEQTSPIDRKLREMGEQPNAVESTSPLNRKLREIEQQDQTAAEATSPLDRKFREMNMAASTQISSPAANNVPTYGNNTPGDYNQYRPAAYRPQDLCSIPQEANIPPHGQIPGSTPQQSFPTGTSSTVPSSFMNRPTPPSTATTPSTNPPTYDDFSDDSRYKQVQYPDDPRYNQGRYPSGNQYRGYAPPNEPYHQRVPYPQSPYEQYHGQPQYIPNPYEHQGYPQQYQDARYPSQQPWYRYPQEGGYSTQHPQQQQPQYHTAYRQYRENPPWYTHNDPMASINPANFTAMPPTPGPSPSPDVYTGMHDRQMARLDRSQLPAEFTHRGPDFGGGMPTESRNTPPPLAPARVPSEGDDHHTTNTSSTLQPQQSYVDFPDDMRRSPHHAAESGHSLGRTPMQQTDVIPHHSDVTQEYSNTSVEAKHAALTNGKSPMPSENATDIVSPLKQLHLEGATTDSTDTQTLQTQTKSIESWDGERKRPMPTQHTDKIPTQELSGSQELCPSQELDPSREASETPVAAAADVHQDQSQHHSAPPVVGRINEDESSLSMGSRVPTQMTEPIG